MGHTQIENSDKGARVIVDGISLEGHRVRGLGTVEGVTQDHFADAVEVTLDNGGTQHFRQESVSGTGMF